MNHFDKLRRCRGLKFSALFGKKSKNVIVSDKVENCERFSKYFSSISGQIAQNIENTDNPLEYLNARNDIRF